MQNIIYVVKLFLLGFFGATAFLMLLLLLADIMLAAPPTQRVQEATIGQQDRTLTPPDISDYDNSDFLRDMDEIARGTYIALLEPDTTEGEDE